MLAHIILTDFNCILFYLLLQCTGICASLSKLATPTPVIHSDMPHVIDDATSTMHDAYDETTSILDTTVPLGEFLDEQLARARENELKLIILMKAMMKILPLDMNCLLFLRVMLSMKKLLEIS